jgi:spermidine/putrescine-binding protein
MPCAKPLRGRAKVRLISGLQGAGMFDVALIKKITLRREALEEWLQEHAPDTFENQEHLDENSQARGYWSHGYQAALADVMELIARQELNNAGSASH